MDDRDDKPDVATLVGGAEALVEALVASMRAYDGLAAEEVVIRWCGRVGLGLKPARQRAVTERLKAAGLATINDKIAGVDHIADPG